MTELCVTSRDDPGDICNLSTNNEPFLYEEQTIDLRLTWRKCCGSIATGKVPQNVPTREVSQHVPTREVPQHVPIGMCPNTCPLGGAQHVPIGRCPNTCPLGLCPEHVPMRERI